MLAFGIVVTVLVIFAEAQEGEVMVPDNKTQCINQMIQWCNNMSYPQQGVGLAILSVTYEDPRGYYRVFCSSDSDGTNCTRNKSPWFTCSPDHVLTYKGQALSSDTSASDVDDDICQTADKAFNELMVQNLSYDNTTLKNEVQKGMEAFFEQMAMMEEQIAMIQKLLKRLPFIGDSWNGFDDVFEPGQPNMSTYMPDMSNQTTTDQANQIERE